MVSLSSRSGSDGSRIKHVLVQADNKTHAFTKIPKATFLQWSGEQRKQYLRARLADVLNAAQIPLDQPIRCFVHEDHRPSMIYNRLKQHLHCFGCMEEGRGLDLFDLAKWALGTTLFDETFKRVMALFVDNLVRPQGTAVMGSQDRPLVYPPYHTDPDCAQFVKGRGITAQTAMRFGLRRWEDPGTKDRYLVIPCRAQFVVRRRYLLVDGDPNQRKYWSPSNREGAAQRKPTLFCGRAYENADPGTVVFVVESALDALLIEQMGFASVALNGAHNGSLLLAEGPRIRSRSLILVILFDQDESQAGQIAAQTLARSLVSQLVDFAVCPFLDYGPGSFLCGTKDIGQAYEIDPTATEEALSEIEDFIVQTRRQRPLPLPLEASPFDNPLARFGVAPTGSQIPWTISQTGGFGDE